MIEAKLTTIVVADGLHEEWCNVIGDMGLTGKDGEEGKKGCVRKIRLTKPASTLARSSRRKFILVLAHPRRASARMQGKKLPHEGARREGKHENLVCKIPTNEASRAGLNCTIPSFLHGMIESCSVGFKCVLAPTYRLLSVYKLVPEQLGT